MEQRLRSSCEYFDIDEQTRNQFFHLRISAENLARSNYCDRRVKDITLTQIYEIMIACGCISNEQAERIKALEIKTELDNIIGISSNIEQVRALVEADNKVVLISDMYLGEEIIRKMLMRIDPLFERIPIYVSSDYGVTKASGSLFEVVAEKENHGQYKQWLHIGDNTDSDILSASSLGIRTDHFCYENLLLYEKQLIDSSESNVTFQLVIGAARNGRLNHKNSESEYINTTEERAFEIGCSIGGPLLLPYIIWILKNSVHKGIKKLCFMARDGYVLKMIADRLIELNGLEIETKYFYGSRKSLRMPSLTMESNDLNIIIDNSSIHMIRSMEEIADLLEVPVELFRDYLPRYEKLSNKLLTTHAVKEIIASLCGDVSFQLYLLEIQQGKRELLLSYIKQEVGEIDACVAFVELFGSGLTQECLSKICKGAGNGPVQTFFMNKVRFKYKESGINYVYMPIDEPLAYITEEMCRAPHGQTVGYKKVNGRIVPILGTDEQEQLKRYGYHLYMEGVMSFVDFYHESIKNNHNIDIKDNTHLYLQYLRYITKTPDKEVLDYFGDMPFNHTGRDKEEAMFAPKLSKEQLQKLFLTRYNEPLDLYYKGSSLEYSLLRCSDEEKELVSRYKSKNKEINWSRVRNSIPGLDVGWGEEHAFADEYDLIAENIILYAAGKKGQLLYSQLINRPEYNIIAWIDSEYMKYQAQQIQVQNPVVIKELEYEQVVIAVLDKLVADEIMTNLLSLGVPRSKILWIQPKVRQ